MRPAGVSYVAVISPIREVILVGTADLAYWRERLRPQALFPYEDNGRASLTISAIAGKFRGLSFREFSVAVAVADGPDGRGHDAMFLAHAYNSSRLMALSERLFFRTPYYPAEIAVEVGPPASARVAAGGRTIFEANRAPTAAPLAAEMQDWEGRIYLPRLGERVGELFYARLAGPTEVYAFDPADVVAFHPRAEDGALSALAESNFAGQEWRIRTAATHARSRTYRR